MKSSVTKTVRR